MAVKHELVYRKTDSVTLAVTEKAMVLPPALRQALSDWNDSQAQDVQTGTNSKGISIIEIQKPYSGLANTIFKYLQDNLFSQVFDSKPTAQMKNLKDKSDLAYAAIVNEKITSLPVLPIGEP